MAIVCPVKQLSLLGLVPLDSRSNDPHARVVVHSLGYTDPDKLPSCSTEPKWLTARDDGEQGWKISENSFQPLPHFPASARLGVFKCQSLHEMTKDFQFHSTILAPWQHRVQTAGSFKQRPVPCRRLRWGSGRPERLPGLLPVQLPPDISYWMVSRAVAGQAAGGTAHANL